MNYNSNLSIGLPDGIHIKAATYKLLQRANLNLLDYKTGGRKYKTELILPSRKTCNVIIDKPKDLLYSLISQKTDIIITGSDYVDEFCLFHDRRAKSIFNSVYGLIESAHLQLNHLGYFGTKLGFMIREDSPYDNLNELILNQDKIICYTEFPIFASRYLSRLRSYQNKFGDSLPSIVSNFSILEGNPSVIIIYSHGATESKATSDKKTLIFDLRLSGNTYKINKLKILQKVGNPIFNLIYKNKNSKKSDEITEFVNIIEATIINNPSFYTISTKM